ncbi:MAG TPA: LamG domain-containing protein [Polyangiaceae bacterium]|nr:LamG domain-containing protein [Polyangiaceae bacterium]
MGEKATETMADRKTRAELKSLFVENAIPTADDFAALIDAGLNQADDRIDLTPGILAVDAIASKTADGDLSLRGSGNGSVRVDDMLTVTGALNANGQLTVTGALNASGPLTVTGPIAVDAIASRTAGGNLTLSGQGVGIVQVDDPLRVTGALTANKGLTVTGADVTIGVAAAAGVTPAPQLLSIHGALDIAFGTRTNATNGANHPTGRPLYVSGVSSAAGAEFRSADGTAGISIGDTTIQAIGAAANADLILRPRGAGTVTIEQTADGPPRKYAGLDKSKSQYIALPTIPGSVFQNGFTIQAWVYFDTLEPWARIIDIGGGPSSNNIVVTVDAYSNLAVHAYNLANKVAELKAYNVLSPHRWTHVAVTIQSNGAMEIFVDGTSRAKRPFDNTTVLPNVARTSNALGKSNWTTDPYLNGRLAEVSLWGTAVTTPTMGPLQGKETGLVGYWKLNDSSAADASSNTVKIGNGTLKNGVLFQAFEIGKDPWLPPTMKVNGEMEVSGALKVGSNFAASSPEQPIRMIWGFVDATADVFTGKGFTVSKEAEGKYRVKFTTSFLARPCVVATVHWLNANMKDNAVVYEITDKSCLIVTGDLNGAVASRHFSFIAIGP